MNERIKPNYSESNEEVQEFIIEEKSNSPKREITHLKTFQETIMKGSLEELENYLCKRENDINFRPYKLNPLITFKNNYHFKKIFIRTALGYCVVFDLYEKAKILLDDKRFDPSENKNEALILGCKFGKTRMVSLLIADERIDITLNNNEAIRWVLSRKNVEIVKLFLDHPKFDPTFEKNLILRGSCLNGHLTIVRMLLKIEGVNVHERRDECIYNAVKNEHFEICEEILKSKRIKCIELKLDAYHSILSWAKKKGKKELVELMIGEREIVSDVIEKMHKSECLFDEIKPFAKMDFSNFEIHKIFDTSARKELLQYREQIMGKFIHFPKKICRENPSHQDLLSRLQLDTFMNELMITILTFWSQFSRILYLKWIEKILDNFDYIIDSGKPKHRRENNKLSVFENGLLNQEILYERIKEVIIKLVNTNFQNQLCDKLFFFLTNTFSVVKRNNPTSNRGKTRGTRKSAKFLQFGNQSKNFNSGVRKFQKEWNKIMIKYYKNYVTPIIEEKFSKVIIGIIENHEIELITKLFIKDIRELFPRFPQSTLRTVETYFKCFSEFEKTCPISFFSKSLVNFIKLEWKNGSVKISKGLYDKIISEQLILFKDSCSKTKK